MLYHLQLESLKFKVTWTESLIRRKHMKWWRTRVGIYIDKQSM